MYYTCFNKLNANASQSENMKFTHRPSFVLSSNTALALIWEQQQFTAPWNKVKMSFRQVTGDSHKFWETPPVPKAHQVCSILCLCEGIPGAAKGVLHTLRKSIGS